MPFQTHQNNQYLIRKEKDSFITPFGKTRKNTPQTSYERVSGFTSRGSITIEASLAVCIFFFAILVLLNLMEMMYLQTTVKSALCSVGKQMAAESYVQPLIFSSQMEKRLVETIGEEVLENSIIVGGARGLDCSRSRNYWTTTIMELVVDYEVQIPIFLFRIPILSQSESVRVKGWSGKEGFGLGGNGDEMVYMTDYGVVYHADISCTYLELSIHPVLKEDANGYTACQLCKNTGGKQMVYITDYGERYHSSLDCRGLKRKVYAVPRKEVYGIGGCSKCVK